MIIGGDGRADSPGHSAKYSSYGIIDISTNKVLHIDMSGKYILILNVNMMHGIFLKVLYESLVLVLKGCVYRH